jgi:hypothetical protein
MTRLWFPATVGDIQTAELCLYLRLRPASSTGCGPHLYPEVDLMPRPAGITDVLRPTPDYRPVREPTRTMTGKELAALLFARKPPGDVQDPRTRR